MPPIPESVRVALGHIPAVVDVLVNDAGRNTDQRWPAVDGGDLAARFRCLRRASRNVRRNCRHHFSSPARKPLTPPARSSTSTAAPRLPGERSPTRHTNHQAEAVLEFTVLGAITASRAGDDVDLGSPQQRSVLALLLLRVDRATSLEQIVEALWEGEAPPGARGTVRTYVYRLRRVLGTDSSIESVAGGYRLRVHRDRWTSAGSGSRWPGPAPPRSEATRERPPRNRARRWSAGRGCPHGSTRPVPGAGTGGARAASPHRVGRTVDPPGLPQRHRGRGGRRSGPPPGDPNGPRPPQPHASPRARERPRPTTRRCHPLPPR
ncbi:MULTISPECIES: AfsR/SARP family transcriptional regulator [Amycolatopsis]|uniref:AfsR/SARP family transcriptional regulator n=1 Tax=Amycolatopsis TaxID=1813 RepID=UPI00357096F0